jgi:RNA polymerase sigma factor (sigma-70 family)
MNLPNTLNNFLIFKILCFPIRQYSMGDPLTIQTVMSFSSRENINSAINQFGKSLSGFIRRRVTNKPDAEDILQDVWYQFMTAGDGEPIGEVGNWLFRVARNKITDSYRKKKLDLIGDLLYSGVGEDELDFKDLFFDDSGNPETEHLRNLFWKELQRALQELPEEQKNVFVWNELEDIPFKEIAESTGENLNTLISRKRYAVLYLRERLMILYEEIINH